MNTVDAIARLMQPQPGTRQVRLINDTTGERRTVEVYGKSATERVLAATRAAGPGWRLDSSPLMSAK